MRTSIERGRPLGDEAWTRRVAARLGLEYALRPRRRPRNPAAATTAAPVAARDGSARRASVV